MQRLLLTDNQLLEAYNQAKKMNLDEAFINMLKKEIEARKLSDQVKTPPGFFKS